MRQWVRFFMLAAMLLLALPAKAAPVWLHDLDQLYLVETSSPTLTPIAANASVKEVSPTADGGTFVLTSRHLLRLDAKGAARPVPALAGLDAAEITRMLADPFDASLWIVDRRGAIRHLEASGKELAAITAETPVRAMALAQDQSLWVLRDTRITRYGPKGQLQQMIDIPAWLSEAPATLLVDSLGGVLWFGNHAQLWRIDLANPTDAPAVQWSSVKVHALALAPKSGTVWSLTDGVLQAYDRSGAAGARIDLAALGMAGPLALASDPADDSLWVVYKGGVGHLSAAGVPLPAPTVIMPVANVAAAPFWIAPRLQLLAPARGEVFDHPLPTFLLGIDAYCSGVPCDLPAGVLAQYKLSAMLDQQDVGPEIKLDQNTGRATFTPSRDLANGNHTFSAVVVDRFGHASDRVSAAFKVDAPQRAQEGGVEALSKTGIITAAGKNTPPTTTMSTSGTSFTPGANIVLSATASDANGSVTGVKFYRATTILVGTGTLSGGVWSFTWNNVAAGSYALTSVATDNAGATGRSGVVNITVAGIANAAPVVSISSPVNGATMLPPASGTFAASASDSNGTIAKIEFYNGTQLLGTTTGNGSATLAGTQAFSNLGLGVHVLKAVATDSAGATATATASINVSTPPLVAMRTPGEYACSYNGIPETVSLIADALAPGGAIAKVEFYVGTTLIGVGEQITMGASASYQLTWVSPPAGTHALTARAYDKAGNVTTSSPLQVKFNLLPSAVLTSPAAGSTFKVGTPIAFTATASDSDGTVARVNYYIHHFKIGSSAVPPYNASWTPGSDSVGPVNLRAEAVDNMGGTSPTIYVAGTIVADVPPTIALSGPAVGGTYVAGSSTTLSVTASAGDYPINSVQYFRNGLSIAIVTAAPFSYTWTNLPVGSHVITAKAVTVGSSTTSAPVTMVVQTVPVVSMAEPLDGGLFASLSTIPLKAYASEPGHTISKVAFYQGQTEIGSATVAPYTFEWKRVPGGTYIIKAVATDERGVTGASDPVTIMVTAPSITITSPAAGAQIDSLTVLVKGRIDAPAYSGVTVNGVVALTDDSGNFYANNVRLVPGANSLVSEVTTIDDEKGTTNVSVNAITPAPWAVSMLDKEAVVELPTGFTITNPGGIKNLVIDYYGDGAVLFDTTGQSNFSQGQTSFTLNLTYTKLGVSRPTLRLMDMQGNVTIRELAIKNHDPVKMKAMFSALWGRMGARLKDSDIEAALTSLTGALRPEFRTFFTALGPNLPSIVDQLGTLATPILNEKFTEYTILRNTAEGQESFPIFFLKSSDGVWRIDGM